MIRTLAVRLALTGHTLCVFLANVFEGDSWKVNARGAIGAIRSHWKYVAKKSRK